MVQLQLPDREQRYDGIVGFKPWMQELCDEYAEIMAAQLASKRHDYDNCDVSELPWYAYEIRAVAWTDTLGEIYSRNSLKLAEEVNRLAGSEACWTLICRALESEGRVDYTYGGTPRQKVGSELFIVPPVHIAANVKLLSHLGLVGRTVVVPYWMNLVAIHVVNRIVASPGWYGIIHSPYAWKVMRSGV